MRAVSAVVPEELSREWVSAKAWSAFKYALLIAPSTEVGKWLSSTINFRMFLRMYSAASTPPWPSNTWSPKLNKASILLGSNARPKICSSSRNKPRKRLLVTEILHLPQDVPWDYQYKCVHPPCTVWVPSLPSYLNEILVKSSIATLKGTSDQCNCPPCPTLRDMRQITIYQSWQDRRQTLIPKPWRTRNWVITLTSSSGMNAVVLMLCRNTCRGGFPTFNCLKLWKVWAFSSSNPVPLSLYPPSSTVKGGEKSAPAAISVRKA